MDNVTLTKYLTSHKKIHLKRCFTNLLDKEHFDQDLFNIDLETLENQLQLLEGADVAAPSFFPYTRSMEAGCGHASQVGIEATKKGLVGCLLLAGGQGTRLGWPGPKGTFSVTLIKKKSLFQFFAEKVKAASVFVNRDLPLAIMTSPLNEAETRQFFQKNNFFGLKPHQLFIFSQTMLPFLDFNKRLVHTRTLAKGPDGNGSCFESFFKSHVGEQWQKSGIEYLNIVLIDNPLADPYDFELLGHLLETAARQDENFDKPLVLRRQVRQPRRRKGRLDRHLTGMASHPAHRHRLLTVGALSGNLQIAHFLIM